MIEEEVVHEEDVEHHEEDGEMIEVQHEEVLEEIVEEDGMVSWEFAKFHHFCDFENSKNRFLTNFHEKSRKIPIFLAFLV